MRLFAVILIVLLAAIAFHSSDRAQPIDAHSSGPWDFHNASAANGSFVCTPAVTPRLRSKVRIA